MRPLDYTMLVSGSLLALALRWAGLDFKSGDYYDFLSGWYDFIRAQGGFGALSHNFANYNVPYLYLLTLASLSPLPKLAAIKLASIIFDFALAGLALLLARQLYPRPATPVLAYLAVLFTPAFFFNSGLWGQCDSIYSAGLVLSLYYLLQQRPLAAFVAAGLAFAFKAQAAFFFPVLLLLVLKRQARAVYFLAIPAVYLVLALPALALGKPPADILLVYLRQADKYNALTLGAPNLYQWLPNTLYDQLLPAGIVFSLLVVAALLWQLGRSPVQLEGWLLVKVTLLFLLVVPFTLPLMHERYFYPAEVVALVLAFSSLKYLAVWAALVICAICTYVPYLFRYTIIDYPYLTPLMLLAVVTVAADVLTELRARRIDYQA